MITQCREKQEKKKAKKAFEDAYKEELVMQLALKESAGYNHKPESINSRCNGVGQSGTRRYVQSKKGTPIPMIEALIKKKLTPEEIAKER